MMKMEMFTILDKAKPDTENIRGLNLVVAKPMTVQVTKLPVYCKLLKIRHNLLFSAWPDRGLVYIVNNAMYTCNI
jgi:hypothetical protein